MIKKVKLIVFLIISLVVLLSVNVYAAEVKLNLTGKDEVKVNEENTIKLKLEADTLVGVVSGKIEKNEEISSLEIKGLNGWQVTYNKETGEFNSLKAEGAQNEEIFEITYKLSETATIIITNVECTTIEYETIEYSNISKEITIKKENNNNNNTNNNTNTNTNINTNVNTNIEVKNQANASVKNNIQKNLQTINNKTNKPNVLPNTGKPYIVSSIVVILMISIFCYFKYKSYKKD